MHSDKLPVERTFGRSGATSYWLYEARVNPLTWRVPILGQLPKLVGDDGLRRTVRYVVRDAAGDWRAFSDLPALIRYHGVATGFGGDVIRIVIDKSARRQGELIRTALIPDRASIDWTLF